MSVSYEKNVTMFERLVNDILKAITERDGVINDVLSVEQLNKNLKNNETPELDKYDRAMKVIRKMAELVDASPKHVQEAMFKVKLLKASEGNPEPKQEQIRKKNFKLG